MTVEVVDTNVLVLATAAHRGWVKPRVPIDAPEVLQRIAKWLAEFRADGDRLLAMDFPHKTILLEYRNNLGSDDYGRRVIQHKFDTGKLHPVDLEYWLNGSEQVACLPTEVRELIHDVGDHKMVAAAYEATATIINAADSDWSDPRVQTALGLLGVCVVELLTENERAACRSRTERDP